MILLSMMMRLSMWDCRPVIEVNYLMHHCIVGGLDKLQWLCNSQLTCCISNRIYIICTGFMSVGM